MINVIVPLNKEEIEKQIKGFEYLLKKDTNEKDRQIHERALEVLKNYLNKFNSSELRELKMCEASRKEIRSLINQEATQEVSERHLTDIEVLTKNNIHEVIKFIKLLRESRGHVYVAIGKYRKEIRQQGRGNISFTEIDEAYKKGDINKLKSLLIELFLEYISQREIKDAVKFAENGNISFKDIYKKHMKALKNNRHDKFMCCVTATYRE
ncbi:hypothetical protein [Brassicibacter mesophilus]|uniref:hypothetical protein n=1 Tax=Brassicibacter mesophilus TaxID=745119 RepID=UPI003D1EA161